MWMKILILLDTWKERKFNLILSSFFWGGEGGGFWRVWWLLYYMFHL